MSTNVTGHACAALDSALDGSTPYTTSEIDQETQVSTVESNHLGFNDGT